jgi:hypothetical protein
LSAIVSLREKWVPDAGLVLLLLLLAGRLFRITSQQMSAA